MSCWRYTPSPKHDCFQDFLEAICPDFQHTNLSKHSQDEHTEEPPPDTSTQTLVNKCLAESGIDPDLKIQTNQRYVFARVNQSNHHLIDR